MIVIRYIVYACTLLCLLESGTVFSASKRKKPESGFDTSQPAKKRKLEDILAEAIGKARELEERLRTTPGFSLPPKPESLPVKASLAVAPTTAVHPAILMQPGLTNGENRCYANALIQCLAQTSIAQDLLTLADAAGELLPAHRAQLDVLFLAAPEKVTLIAELIKLVHALKHAGQRIITTTNFFKSIIAVYFENDRAQQDTKDFYGFLIDDVTNALTACSHAYQSRCTLLEKRIRRGNPDQACRTCHKVYHEENSDPASVLAVSVAGKDTLTQCIDDRLQTKEFQYWCEQCDSGIADEYKNWFIGDEEAQITQLPEILVIHLGRFSYGKVIDKSFDRVAFPVRDFQPIAALPQRYELIGVVQHSGATVHSGHYTAYIKNAETGVWYYCNDTIVAERDETFIEAMGQHGCDAITLYEKNFALASLPYLLMYRVQR